MLGLLQEHKDTTGHEDVAVDDGSWFPDMTPQRRDILQKQEQSYLPHPTGGCCCRMHVLLILLPAYDI